MNAETGDAPQKSPNNPPRERKLNPRQLRFAQLVAAGMSGTAAYRKSYGRHPRDARKAADGAKEVMSRPGVREYVEELRKKNEGRTLMTMNEQLELLAASARHKPQSAADRSAQARVIEVYSKISGDRAPDRVETIVKGDPSAPLSVNVTQMSRAEKAQRMAKDLNLKMAPSRPPSAAPYPAEINPPEPLPPVDLSTLNSS